MTGPSLLKIVKRFPISQKSIESASCMKYVIMHVWMMMVMRIGAEAAAVAVVATGAPRKTRAPVKPTPATLLTNVFKSAMTHSFHK